jgi:cobalt/nickel transport system permease protein
MHMADALMSPAVGGVMWAISGGLLAWCSRQVRRLLNDRMIPMMGVLGAFIFAAQMINFSIPGTGSSGHLGGGLILAALLGPYAAFIVIASVLTVQALFFADGGLLALGCNIFNLGFFPAFVAYPLIYKPLVKSTQGGLRFWMGAIGAAVVGLQLGAFCVVLETTLSGISDLPFSTFVWMMLPIHLAIGVVEGVATGAVVLFVLKARPGLLGEPVDSATPPGGGRKVIIGLLAATLIVGGVVSWFASTHPDGLEWAMAKVKGKNTLESQAGMSEKLADIQATTAFLPDYGFKKSEPSQGESSSWPAPSAGTSVSGLVGGLLTLVLAVGAGWLLRAKGRSKTMES